MATYQTNPHWIEISRSSLTNNLSVVKKQLRPKTKIMAMVKSNAYGHGLVVIAPLLASKINFFGVNTLQEALSIRRLGIKTSILITAPINPADLSVAHKHHLSLCVHSLKYLNALHTSNLPLHLHLKINTGMNRLGLSLIELLTAINIVRHSKLFPEGIYTHLHSSDTNPDSVVTQLDLFNQAVFQTKYYFPGILAHAANSAAIFNYSQSHFDLVRVGHALYGLHSHPKLKPVLIWKSRVVQSRNLLPYEVVGYGGSYSSPSPINMSVLPIGYSDGLDRKLGNIGHVYCKNKLFPIIGRIAMNFTTIATGNSRLQSSDVVELIGPHISAKSIADLLDTIDYEIVSRLNSEIPRIQTK